MCIDKCDAINLLRIPENSANVGVNLSRVVRALQNAEDKDFVPEKLIPMIMRGRGGYINLGRSTPNSSL